VGRQLSGSRSIPDDALSRENLYPDRWWMRVLVDTNILVRAVQRNHPLMSTLKSREVGPAVFEDALRIGLPKFVTTALRIEF
jgi:hypothetical protein